MKFKKSLNEDTDLGSIFKWGGVKFSKISKTRNGFEVDFGEFVVTFTKSPTIPWAFDLTIEVSTLDDLEKVGETLKKLGKINFADWA